MTFISQPLAKRPLRPCLSPTRLSRSPSPTPEASSSYLSTSRSPSVCSTTSSTSCYIGPNGILMKRAKSVQWAGDEREGCAVTSYHDTWSATEYDRTPLAPPSELERACTMPARGSRCFSEDGMCETLVDEPEAISPARAESPAAADGDDDDDGAEAEWDECDRRRMMFARMCPGSLEPGNAQPQFEGYRSMSATLAELLRQISGDDGPETPRVRKRDDADKAPSDAESDAAAAADDGDDEVELELIDVPRGRCLFFRLRGSSADSTATDTTDATDSTTGLCTPSLVSSAGSEVDSLVASPERRSPSVEMADPDPDLGPLGPLAKVSFGHELDDAFSRDAYHEHALSLF
ncbi:hypothetical protein Q5752_000372 [Cryptotrichosporon argae]